MRQHGTLWDTRQFPTHPYKSGLVGNHDSSAYPDRHRHHPIGVSGVGCDVARLNGSFLVAAGCGGRGAAENQSLKNFQIGLHRGS